MVASWGTKGEPSKLLRTVRSTIMAYTKVAVNTPRASWLARSRMNERSTLGENWLLVSCRTTTVMEKTRPVKVIIEEVMVDSSVRAASGPPVNTSGDPTRTRRWSIVVTSMASPIATATHTPGTSQRLERTISRRWERRMFDPSPPDGAAPPWSRPLRRRG